MKFSDKHGIATAGILLIVVGAAVTDLNFAIERCWAPYRVFSLT